MRSERDLNADSNADFKCPAPLLLVVRRPVDRGDRLARQTHASQLHTHIYPGEFRDLLAHLLNPTEHRQRNALGHGAAGKEGELEGAVLHKRIGTPSLEIGAELGSVAPDGAPSTEVRDSDRRTKDEEGLAGEEMAVLRAPGAITERRHLMDI